LNSTMCAPTGKGATNSDLKELRDAKVSSIPPKRRSGWQDAAILTACGELCGCLVSQSKYQDLVLKFNGY
ncbi:MAG: hypothetical protein OXC62_05945, partial [Aestuariivita sp.]|nr:hypothetical protein [Aestuariivita sp.]